MSSAAHLSASDISSAPSMLAGMPSILSGAPPLRARSSKRALRRLSEFSRAYGLDANLRWSIISANVTLCPREEPEARLYCSLTYFDMAAYSLFSGGERRMSGVWTLRGMNSGTPSKEVIPSLARRKKSGLSWFLMDSSIMPLRAKNPGSSRSSSSLKFSESPLCGVAVRNRRCLLMPDSASPSRYLMVLEVALPYE